MNLLELPFDQYQRYRAVADVLQGSPEPPDLVLEVGGGGESHLAEFLPGAEVVIADLEMRDTVTSQVRRVRADACCPLPFRDSCFGAAVTIDTLEHLPVEARPLVVRELRRVATGPVVLACPVADHGATAAELALELCYEFVFRKEHRWLSEHLANGLPTLEEIEGILSTLGGAWRRHCNGYLPEWQALMLVQLLFDNQPGGVQNVSEMQVLNAHYNERLYPFSNRAPAYRMIWVHSRRSRDLRTAPLQSKLPARATDRARWEALFRPTQSALGAAREQLRDDELQMVRRLHEADREQIERASLAAIEQLRVHSEEIERVHLASLGKIEQLQASLESLTAERTELLELKEQLDTECKAWNAEARYLQRTNVSLVAERERLQSKNEAILAEVGDLRWRLGRVRLFDRTVDVLARVIRPVRSRLRQRRGFALTPEPYGQEVQAQLAQSNLWIAPNGGPLAAPLTLFVCVPEGREGDMLARTRASLGEQRVPPAAVREVAVIPGTLADAASGTHVGFVLAGDRLPSNACAELAHVLAEQPDATVVFTDEDEWPTDGRRRHPQLKPDWDPELARASGYVGSLACFRRDLLSSVPRGLTVSELAYALTLAAVERDEGLAHHVPLVLYHADPANRRHRRLDSSATTPRALLASHLTRCGDFGQAVPAGPGFQIRRPVDSSTAVSIIVPFRDGPELTSRCVQSLRAHNRHPSWEIILVDNGSTDPRAEQIVTSLQAEEPERVQVLRYPLPYNFSAMNNLAARRARGDVLVLLNNDTEILTDDWLTTLIGLASRSGVGAVGVLLLYPNGSIQHCGIALGAGACPGRPYGVAGLILRGCAPGSVDPLLYAYDRRCAAVTAACLAVRRDRYLETGGLDETLRNDFNDVDFCLKLDERGLRNLYTPHVRVMHHESLTRSYRMGDPEEHERMYERWGHKLARDPHLSPHLDRTTLQPALALRPVPGEA
jgi:GT2 family glycosyltransferase